jgi:hypothetical protein
MNVKELKGKPSINLKKFSGYLLWKKSNGFHIRWMTKKGKKDTFQGILTYQDKIMITEKINIQSEDKLSKKEGKTLKWEVKGQDQLVGFTFLTPRSFTLELKVNNKNLKPNKIFIGPNMLNPEDNPFMVDRPIRKIVPKPVLSSIPESKPIFESSVELESEPLDDTAPVPESKTEKSEVFPAEPEYKPVTEPEPLDDTGLAPESETERIKEIPIEPEYKPVPEPEPLYEEVPESRSEVENIVESANGPIYDLARESESNYEPETEKIVEAESEPIFESEEEPFYDSEPKTGLNTEYEVKNESNLDSVVENLPVYKDVPIKKSKIKSSEEEKTEETTDDRIVAWLNQLKEHRK